MTNKQQWFLFAREENCLRKKINENTKRANSIKYSLDNMSFQAKASDLSKSLSKDLDSLNRQILADISNLSAIQRKMLKLKGRYNERKI